MGMPHRGKLELLACLLDLPPALIFSKVSNICLLAGELVNDLNHAVSDCMNDLNVQEIETGK